MKITKQQLRQIIIEEKKSLIKEFGFDEFRIYADVSRVFNRVSELLDDLDPESEIAEQVLLARNSLQQAVKLAGGD